MVELFCMSAFFFIAVSLFIPLKESHSILQIHNILKYQGLQICRILKAGGHKIILADMKKFEFSASRFSWCVDKWVTLPNIETLKIKNMAPSPDSFLG